VVQRTISFFNISEFIREMIKVWIFGIHSISKSTVTTFNLKVQLDFCLREESAARLHTACQQQLVDIEKDKFGLKSTPSGFKLLKSLFVCVTFDNSSYLKY
jgi:hypothetical protein